MRPWAIVALFALIAVASVACGNDDGPAPLPSPTPSSGDVTVDIYDGEHPTLNIYAGTRVRWRNLGDIAHTVVFKDGSLDTGVIEEGQRTGYIMFDKPGIIEYFDRLNPGMKAKIQVNER